MNFLEGEFYHIYNRGNNKQKIFFSRENYLYFLNKIRNEIKPYCEILAYCLMPNHYHLLVYVPETGIGQTTSRRPTNEIVPHPLIRKIGSLQSSYTRAIQNQIGNSGSIFQQKAKSKDLSIGRDNYLLTCFHYIHQNPFVANLVQKIEDWEFSSFKDYIGERNGTLVNKELAEKYLDIDFEHFYKESYQTIDISKIKNIY